MSEVWQALANRKGANRLVEILSSAKCLESCSNKQATNRNNMQRDQHNFQHNYVIKNNLKEKKDICQLTMLDSKPQYLIPHIREPCPLVDINLGWYIPFLNIWLPERGPFST
jgi:hypothetical protein